MPMLMTSLLNSLTDTDVIDSVLKEDLNFALFRLPSETKAHLYVSDECVAVSEVADDEAFVFSSFDGSQVTAIEARYSRLLPVTPFPPVTPRGDDMPPMPDDYARRIDMLVSRLKSRGGKTVFAVTRECVTQMSLYEIFMRLAALYPDAFVFCWKCSGMAEAWIGATPEVLACTADGQLTTMALAGTRPRGGGDAPWDVKNMEEQRMVSEFIVGKCREAGLSPLCGEPHTKEAGPVEHICTSIGAKTPAGFDSLRLACELAPTPAVSGLPRADALADIRELEVLDRGCYGGWCGLLLKGDCSLYVTLRCMAVDPYTGASRLYAGGGITAMSVPCDEWREVNAKFRTLLDILDHNLPV